MWPKSLVLDTQVLAGCISVSKCVYAYLCIGGNVYCVCGQATSVVFRIG